MDKRTLLTVLSGMLPMLSASFTALAADDPAATVIALERAALDRWGNGDPMGFVEIAAPTITYFDPMLERRVDGRAAFARYMDGIKGKVHLDRYELLNPTVELAGNLAVLSFNYVSHQGAASSRWNSTEVYHHDPEGWRLLHSHWSQTTPGR